MNQEDSLESQSELVEWALSSRLSWVLASLTFLLFPLGLFLFSDLASSLRPAYSAPDIVIQPGQWLVGILQMVGMLVAVVALIFALFALHEFCHGIIFKWAGARPRYGAKLLHGFLPIFYATAPGHELTKQQFMIVAVAPTMLVNLTGILLMALPSPLRYVLVLPLSIHFVGCVADWWMLYVVARLPNDVLIEDTKTGFRYRRRA